MHDPSPGDFTAEAAARLVGYGQLWPDEQLRQRLLQVRRDELTAFLDALTESSAHSVVFRGTRAR